jgi:hypothetical protein
VRVLLAVSRHPWPPRRGDQVRALQLARLLAAHHEVTLLAPAGAGAGPPSGTPFRVETYRGGSRGAPAGVANALARGLPLQSGLFHHPHLGRRLRELAPRHDLVVLQLVRLAAHAGDLGSTPWAVDLVDSLSLNFTCRARFDRPWLAPWWRLEARRLLAAEGRLLAAARAGLLVGERDREWLARRLPAERAARLRVVPLVVTPPPAGPSPGEGRAGLALTGNLGYFVNADAVTWWLGRVWPLLAARRPELTVTVAGARPGRRVRRAARRPGVRLLASPPDLGAVLGSAAVALAPLRAGSGVPVKVLEAWAAEVPVVASPWAASGAGGCDGIDLLVADSPEGWCRAVLRLLDDPGLGRRLAAAGRARLAAEHTPQAAAEALQRALF